MSLETGGLRGWEKEVATPLLTEGSDLVDVRRRLARRGVAGRSLAEMVYWLENGNWVDLCGPGDWTCRELRQLSVEVVH